MSKTFNVWLAMDQGFRTELWAYVKSGTLATTFPDINNIAQTTADFLLGVKSTATVSKSPKEWNAAGRNYELWTFYSSKPDETAQVRTDFDILMASYPQDFSVSGAWHWDGRQVGTQWDNSDPPELTGTPWYPNPPQLVNLMPDVWNGDDPPTYSPATEPYDWQIAFGQGKRVFT